MRKLANLRREPDELLQIRRIHESKPMREQPLRFEFCVRPKRDYDVMNVAGSTMPMSLCHV
ncbi:MAG: hypothetical protein WBD07_07880 [Vicinamibacterales bacterium]